MKTPYDGRFKGLAEDHPDLLLRLLGIVAPGTKLQAVDQLRELQLDPVQVDHLYRLREDDRERIVHCEAVSTWTASRVPKYALYHFLARQKYKRDIESYLVLMAEEGAPKRLDDRLVYHEGKLRVEVEYGVIRLWEIDPGFAFEAGNEALLSWVPLLKGGLDEFERAASDIERLRETPERAPYPLDVMVSDIATLAALRYDKGVIGGILRGLREKIMLTTELFEHTWLYQDGLAEGTAKGKAEGKAEGLLAAKRDDVRLIAGARFPELAGDLELGQLDSAEALDGLMVAIVRAQSADEVRKAMRAAVRRQ